MAAIQPFRAARYRVDDPADVAPLTSPPYDVFDADRRNLLAAGDPRNVVRVDYPLDSDGPDRYEAAADLWQRWLEEGTLTVDPIPAFYIYRMRFVDDAGRDRRTSGVVGALEVADEGSGSVLPHEQTTPKAKTDRLDLLRATRVNLSPVWGLSLASGLSALLEAPAEKVAEMIDEDTVTHTIERVDDPARVAAIAACVADAPVMIADGHHRYAVSRTYRDERRPLGDEAASWTMTYVAELTPEQLSIAAIHRLVTGADLATLVGCLERFYDLEPTEMPTRETLADMDAEGTLRLVAPGGRCWRMHEKPGAFSGVEDLDSARLAVAIEGSGCELAYQHGLDETLAKCDSSVTAAVLIRPVSIEAIRSTADRRALMPPKSTFFTPKLRTGLVFRGLDAD